MRVNDTVAGIVLACCAALMFALTLSFPPFPGQKFGPSLFPRILAVLIVVCSALLILRSRKSGAPQPALELADWMRDPRKLTSFALILGATLFYIFASEAVGFIPVAFLILIGLFLWFGARPLVALPVAIVATWMIHYFFGTLMRVPLPRGLLNNIL